MKDKLKVAILQSDLVWENADQNRINFSNQMTSILEPVDLIILPEMFTTGFSMNPESIYETMNGNTVSWLQELAIQKEAAITGSIVIKENENYYNRLLFVTPNGHIEHYDKKHTFTLAGENKVYSAGSKLLSIDYLGWKIRPLVCYDLRFPVWSRNTNEYDILIYVANWPKVRIAAWDALLKARAIENMSYCIGVNRVGLDGNNHEYSGHSAVYDVMGERIDSISEEKEIAIVTLDKDHIATQRAKLGFLKDRDSFTLS
ncbi:amidohydrolase [Subsaximicrobium wynnwilliamsii]|uniref:Omega-amidase YafV n=1 Tax=Subsaximicrobium wynnwilliamsii TaxID=291179 RepID=A0A5C6ZK26_9FLAO|nr:amidohydrolase [Subsaximicrobium wynnwilliamsii]TXD83706.1 amidohydrolase [Subsaximicrobium wynnwilliamsii]TXD89410.1 amidohydrolase [Subsaximicrobium wynnwilliamsii]TXE03543.1 amidohydrolase [Subsaximicrobium wynnwilliamsii]